MIHYQDFKSSMLASGSYDDEKNELTVNFTTGKTYTYKDVAINTWQDLCNSVSVGKFFNSIKNTLKQK